MQKLLTIKSIKGDLHNHETIILYLRLVCSFHRDQLSKFHILFNQGKSADDKLIN